MDWIKAVFEGYDRSVEGVLVGRVHAHGNLSMLAGFSKTLRVLDVIDVLSRQEAQLVSIDVDHSKEARPTRFCLRNYAFCAHLLSREVANIGKCLH